MIDSFKVYCVANNNDFLSAEKSNLFGAAWRIIINASGEVSAIIVDKERIKLLIESLKSLIGEDEPKFTVMSGSVCVPNAVLPKEEARRNIILWMMAEKRKFKDANELIEESKKIESYIESGK